MGLLIATNKSQGAFNYDIVTKLYEAMVSSTINYRDNGILMLDVFTFLMICN